MLLLPGGEEDDHDHGEGDTIGYDPHVCLQSGPQMVEHIKE